MKHRSLDVSRETRDALHRFLDLLARWNRTVNLVSANELSNIWHRHIDDCLQLAPLLPAGISRAIDLGSGAGFPGLILAIATKTPFDLVEADQRKAAFLREASRITQAPVTVHAVRIETANLPAARLITARALAPLPRLLELASPLLHVDGVCLFPKGANVQAELTDSTTGWHMQTERIPSITNPDACILRISHLSRVDNSEA